MLVKLKEGKRPIGNSHFELNPGYVTDIPDEMFDSEVMEKATASKVVAEKKPEKVEKKVEKIEAKPEKEKKSFREELIDLPGIGPKIAEQILKMATTKEGFAKIPHKTLIDELRDDVVVVLDKYLGRR